MDSHSWSSHGEYEPDYQESTRREQEGWGMFKNKFNWLEDNEFYSILVHIDSAAKSSIGEASSQLPEQVFEAWKQETKYPPFSFKKMILSHVLLMKLYK